MRLAFNKPCRSKSAIHSASPISVFCLAPLASSGPHPERRIRPFGVFRLHLRTGADGRFAQGAGQLVQPLNGGHSCQAANLERAQAARS
jgi:hypothetical protein